MPESPNLITLRLGDLLRCMFKTTEKKVIALMTKIVIMDNENQQGNSNNTSSILDIIRVKNRLNRETKDILINAKFIFGEKSCISEIQLGINSEEGDFIKKSFDYAHFLYELLRNPFGCIDEMCRVWAKLDERSSWFVSKFNEEEMKD